MSLDASMESLRKHLDVHLSRPGMGLGECTSVWMKRADRPGLVCFTAHLVTYSEAIGGRELADWCRELAWVKARRVVRIEVDDWEELRAWPHAFQAHYEVTVWLDSA